MKALRGLQIVGIAVLFCASLVAQQPQPDGSLTLIAGGVSYSWPTIRPDGIISNWNFSLFAGGLVHADQIQNTIYSLQTGPILGQTPGPDGKFHYQDGASFGQGGWFEAYASGKYFCQSFCEFKGHFVWATLNPVPVQNGRAFAYRLEGELRGTLTDGFGKVHRNCPAYFSQPVDIEPQHFGDPGETAMGGGGLDVRLP